MSNLAKFVNHRVIPRFRVAERRHVQFAVCRNSTSQPNNSRAPEPSFRINTVKILAVDTSGYEGSIAISEDRQLIEERFLHAEGRRHAQTLVSEVDGLLKSLKLAATDIDCVAVSIGPGSFTGLRVGVVFAKTYAWANKTRLVAVDTLRAVAMQVSSDVKTVSVISDAQRREGFVNDYVWDDASQSRVATGIVRIEPIESIVDGDTSANRYWTGPGLTRFASEFPDTSKFAPESAWNPKASSIADVGSLMNANNTIANMYTLEPLYIRRSYAEEKVT
jgi:tRNA threonylcarbamoyladenosine biosynthesis protein TsaB